MSRSVSRMVSSNTPATRSLADDLRERDDDELAALLRQRPDLIHPVPPDLTALVSRASTSVSTARALDRLDAWTLQIAEVLAALPDPCPVPKLLKAVSDVAPHHIERALAALRERALIWGSGDLHLVRSVREAVGAWPCGLHPAGLTDLSSKAVLETMKDAPADARAVIDQLLWGPPIGKVPSADRVVTVQSANTPIEWLLARSLLVPVDNATVAIPREVALPLRGGAFLRVPEPEPPTLSASGSDATSVAQTAGQSAFNVVRLTEDLLDHWSITPPGQLRSGGLGVRDLTATARLLDTDEPTTSMIIEVAHAAGLLASDEEERPVWLPTSGYDVWLGLDIAERWGVLATAWLGLQRVPALVHERDERVNALSADLDRPDAPDMRRLVLDTCAAGARTADDVREQLSWKRPRRSSRLRDLVIASTLREAELLGVTGLAVMSAPGLALLSSDEMPRRSPTKSASPMTAILAPLLPTPLDYVLLQTDLTVVAPGPLESFLARELALVADVESTGGATVYRISGESLRRAFDAGRSAHEVVTFFEKRSRTPIPQPLSYLIEDVARRHGAVRVGPAGSYVRCDDEVTIGAIMADRRAAHLRPVRLAPGVLALQGTVDEALTTLRAIGLAPAAEAPDGTVVIRRPDSRRAPARPRATYRTTDPTTPDPLLVSSAVKALRAGDRIATGSRPVGGPDRLGVIPVSAPADTIAAIRSAITDERSVWIGYADTDGRATERIIDPIEISRGFLTAYDHRYEEVRSFALARITGVAENDES